MKIYIARMAEDWNPDFLVAAANLQTMVKVLNENLFEEEEIYIEEKEMVKTLREREKAGYVNLLDFEEFDIPEEFGLSIEVTTLEGYKKQPSKKNKKST